MAVEAASILPRCRHLGPHLGPHCVTMQTSCPPRSRSATCPQKLSPTGSWNATPWLSHRRALVVFGLCVSGNTFIPCMCMCMRRSSVKQWSSTLVLWLSDVGQYEMSFLTQSALMLSTRQHRYHAQSNFISEPRVNLSAKAHATSKLIGQDKNCSEATSTPFTKRTQISPGLVLALLGLQSGCLVRRQLCKGVPC